VEAIEQTQSKKMPWWGYPLVGLLFVICLPFIIVCLPIILVIGIVYLFTAPFEKRKFRKSGYDKVFPKYKWKITHSAHYKIFKKLKEQNIPFEYEVHTDKDSGNQVIYILKNDNECNYILCNDLDVLDYSEEKNDWIFCDWHDHSHGHIEELSQPFQTLKSVGESKYPKNKANYFVCVSGKEKQKDSSLHKDKRFIEWQDVLTLARGD